MKKTLYCVTMAFSSTRKSFGNIRAVILPKRITLQVLHRSTHRRFLTNQNLDNAQTSETKTEIISKTKNETQTNVASKIKNKCNITPTPISVYFYLICGAIHIGYETYTSGKKELLFYLKTTHTENLPYWNKRTEEGKLEAASHGCKKNLFCNVVTSPLWPFIVMSNIMKHLVIMFNDIDEKK